MRWFLALMLVSLCCLAGPARSDQNDPSLPGLFDRLKTTTDPFEARQVEGQIWETWMVCEDPEVNRLMAEGIEAMATVDYPTALKAFDHIVTIAPNFAEGWNKRATVLYLMGDFDRSIQDVDKTLALEPRHFGALSGLGLIETELNHEEEALDAFQRALAINPHMPGAQRQADELRRHIKDREI
jgi:tetratricopeptide (TPR) repeat protein